MAETVRHHRVRVLVDTYVTGDDGAQLVKSYSYDKTFTEGTGADQLGSVLWDDSRALDTTSEDLDVAGGLTDFQGAASGLNNIKFLLIENLDTDTGDNIKLKPGSTAPVTTILSGTSPVLDIGPGGLLLLVNPVDGYTVTATSADKLAVEAVDDSTYLFAAGGDNA